MWGEVAAEGGASVSDFFYLRIQISNKKNIFWGAGGGEGGWWGIGD